MPNFHFLVLLIKLVMQNLHRFSVITEVEQATRDADGGGLGSFIDGLQRAALIVALEGVPTHEVNAVCLCAHALEHLAVF